MGDLAALKFVGNVSRLVAIACLFALLGVVMLNVVLRTFFGIAVVWSFEVAQLLLLWVAFLGAALAFREREKGHIQVRVLLDRLPAWAATPIQLVVNLLVLGVLAVILIGAFERSPTAWRTSRGVVQWLSFGWFYLALIVGVGLSILFVLVWTVDLFRPKRRPQNGDN
jgi:TRAP-type transport system small permease protein